MLAVCPDLQKNYPSKSRKTGDGNGDLYSLAQLLHVHVALDLQSQI